jgi:hypothetical protein
MSSIYPATSATSAVAPLPSPALPAPQPPPPRSTDPLKGDFYAEAGDGDGIPTPDI